MRNGGHLSTCGGVQLQARRGSDRYPHGQGFIAAIRLNSAGKANWSLRLPCGILKDTSTMEKSALVGLVPSNMLKIVGRRPDPATQGKGCNPWDWE
jgi:hypothetical protein